MLSEIVLSLTLWVLFAIDALLLRPPESRDVHVLDHEMAEFRVLLNEAREAGNWSEVRDIGKNITALSCEKNMTRALADLTAPDFETRLANLKMSALEMKLAVYSEMNELQAEHAKGALETIQTHLRWKISLFFCKVHTHFFCS
jgi:hypothetical protein